MILVLVLLISAVVFTIVLVQNQQIFKGKAQEVQTENSLASSTGKLGFNYYPYGYYPTPDWPGRKLRYERELIIMKSFGASVIRMPLHEWIGYRVYENRGGIFTADYQTMLTTLPEVLQIAQNNGFEVIIDFMGRYFYGLQTNNQRVPPWTWQWAYGNTEEGFQRFIRDETTFRQGIINVTRNSPNILYYDILNESTSPMSLAPWPRMWDYVRYAWDNLQNIPPGKWGISIDCTDDEGGCANQPNAVDALEATLSAIPRGKERLNFIDFHVYPFYMSQQLPFNMNMEKAYNKIHAKFPNVKVIVGETNMRLRWINLPGLTAAQKEDIQSSTESAILDRALPLPIDKVLHYDQLWDVCDDGPPGCIDDHQRGWGYTHSEPRDVYGKMAERFSLIPNSDFEQGTTSPTGWSVGGNGASLVWGTGEPDSATNNHYGRVRTSSSNALVWLTHNVLNVPQTNTGFELYLNAYARSNMRSVLINIVEYDGNRNRTRVTSMPSYVPTSGQWENLQYKIGPWKMTLLPNTRYLNVAFGGTSGITLPATLDVDAVTLNLRELLTAPTSTPIPTPSPTPTSTPTPRPTATSTPIPTRTPTPTPTAVPVRGDINEDGRVDFNDLVILLTRWIENQPPGRADLNGDNKVDYEDYRIMLGLLGY